MSNQLTYGDTMALAQLTEHEEIDTQGTGKDFAIMLLDSDENGTEFIPFDSRWCGAYIQEKLGSCEIELDEDDNWTCSRGSLDEEAGRGKTLTEAVARCVLAVMRERGELA